MLKFLIIILIQIFLLIFTPYIAQAQTPTPTSSLRNPALFPIQGGGRGVGEDWLNTVLPNIVLVFFIIAAVVFVFYFIYNALKWITSGGDKAAVEDARRGILNAILGLLVLFFIYVFVKIANFLLGLNIGNLGGPVDTLVNVNPPPGGFQNLSGATVQDLAQTFVSRAIQFLLVGSSIIFLFMLIRGGINWIASGGDKQKIESAKKTLTNALIGLLIVFSAFVTIKVINTLFRVNIGGLGPSTPQIVNINPPPGAFQNLGTATIQNLAPTFLSRAIQFILVASVIIFFFMFVYGGFRWITSAGDKLAVESARRTVTNALTGLVIVFLVFMLLRTIGIIFRVNLLGDLSISGLGGVTTLTPTPGSSPTPGPLPTATTTPSPGPIVATLTPTPLPTNTPVPTSTPIPPPPTATNTPVPTNTLAPPPTNTPVPPPTNTSRPTPAPVTCLDSDGGLDYYSYGAVIGTGAGCNPLAWTYDSCIDASTLSEMYCGSGNACMSQVTSCANGCLGGVCQLTPGVWIAANDNQSCTAACADPLINPTSYTTCDPGRWNDDASCSLLQSLTSCTGCYSGDPIFGADANQPYRLISAGGYTNICVRRRNNWWLGAFCGASDSDYQRICHCI